MTRDVVDLELAHGGDVYKMILGSFNEEYDHSETSAASPPLKTSQSAPAESSGHTTMPIRNVGSLRGHR